jgi:hypothetical protein
MTQVGPLKETELQEADRIARLAFGTFLESRLWTLARRSISPLLFEIRDG